jgi:hypothetical protein
MECTGCHARFCFMHSGAHVGRSCAEYIDSIAGEERQSAALLGESKPCPGRGCGALIYKSEGCNHMVCSRCSTNFCWLCGEECDRSPTPAHFFSGRCSQFSARESLTDGQQAAMTAAIRRFAFLSFLCRAMTFVPAALLHLPLALLALLVYARIPPP